MAKVTVRSITKKPSFSKYKNFLKADLKALTEDQEKDCFYVDDYFGKGEPLFVVDDTPEDWEDLIGSHDKEKGKITRTGDEKVKLIIRDGFKEVDELLEDIGWEGLTEREASEEEALEEAKKIAWKSLEWHKEEAEDLMHSKDVMTLTDSGEIVKSLLGFIKNIENAIKAVGGDDVTLTKLEKLPAKLKDRLDSIKEAIEEAKEEEPEIVINDILFLDVNESKIKKMGDSDDVLEKLGDFELTDEHKSSPLFNTPQHRHLDGGKGGLAFTYRKEDDDSITPIVYDYATERSNSGTGNSYSWKNNSASSGPPSLPSGAK